MPPSRIPLAVFAALAGALASASAARAGIITGRVELADKGGRRATDMSDVVVYVDGARLKPKPATAG